MKQAIFFVLMSLSIPGFSQEYLAEAVPGRMYQQGVDLLEKKKFSAARETFEQYLAQSPDGAHATEAQYYAAYSAVRLYNQDGEAQLAEFMREHSSHPKALRANYELGNFYFNEQRYDKVIEYFGKTDTRNLSLTEEEVRNFKLGYAYFTQQEFEKAEPLFDLLKNSENPYQSAAHYYAGYIALENGNYEEALKDLRRIEQNESYGRAVPFLIANILNQQGRYDQLKSYGEKILQRDQKEVTNFSEIMLLVGEANYRQERYADAEPFLRSYAESRNPSQDILYRLGYAQYQLGKTEEAIENLTKAAAAQDSIGQFASFYLGVLYTNQNNSEYAVTAFETATQRGVAQKSFDDDIREQALFNLGKTRFDREEYGRAIQSFNQLKEDYPQTQFATEANNLLSEAYLYTQNYAEAIQFIESLPNKTLPVRTSYQQVSYRAGTQAFNQRQYRKAVELFDKSLEYPIDQTLVAGANFWKGEAYSIGKFWDKAINAYEAAFRRLQGNRLEGEKELYYTKAQYGIGYAYFNTKQYSQALRHFQKYVQQSTLRQNLRNQDKFYLSDALLRLADSYYVTKSYQQALQTYDKAIQEDTREAGYAYYQKGVIYGILGNQDQGIQVLDQVLARYQNSPYYDDALFQKAQLQLQQGDYQQATQSFGSLVETQPQSNLVPYALLQRALAYSNQQQYRQAEQDYKKILDNYMAHSTANSAILGLQEVTAQSGSTDFPRYLAQYKEANPEDANVASIEYESAKNLYFSQKYDQAIQQLQSFIETYPDNANVPEANYYTGESYYRLGRLDEALDIYYALTTVENHPQNQRIMQRIAELESSQQNYANAVTYFQKLAQTARSKKQQYNAWQGLMTSYYQLAQENANLLDSVDYYAQQILERANVSTNAANQASLYRGRAAYEQGNLDQAEPILTELASVTPDENGAEAQYLTARIYYERGNYQQSIDALYELNKKFGAYEDWLGRSFLLIAENYQAMDEIFQAKATLNSIIDNSPQEDVVSIAKDRLAEIALEEAEQQQKQQAADSAQQESENEIILEEVPPKP
ncbi:tetratricopeptide repeat protein [Tunicatimonas pelagia]|uniref:tetratricopeptide repeat protein n=1 Tax=Tunicatimonas pelagia TaxID=931531 RepID=UPI0026657912|nr:tetratricopeptide repeat protein [Tunicatimonas pelagia]WKN41955.1 tetratricopeptide repeat protein [Tunicatimonas pelagia]